MLSYKFSIARPALLTCMVFFVAAGLRSTACGRLTAWATAPSAALRAIRLAARTLRARLLSCKQNLGSFWKLSSHDHGICGRGVLLESFAPLLRYSLSIVFSWSISHRIVILDFEASRSHIFPWQDRMIFLHPNAMSSIGRPAS